MPLTLTALNAGYILATVILLVASFVLKTSNQIFLRLLSVSNYLFSILSILTLISLIVLFSTDKKVSFHYLLKNAPITVAFFTLPHLLAQLYWIPRLNNSFLFTLVVLVILLCIHVLFDLTMAQTMPYPGQGNPTFIQFPKYSPTVIYTLFYLAIVAIAIAAQKCYYAFYK